MTAADAQKVDLKKQLAHLYIELDRPQVRARIVYNSFRQHAHPPPDTGLPAIPCALVIPPVLPPVVPFYFRLIRQL